MWDTNLKRRHESRQDWIARLLKVYSWVADPEQSSRFLSSTQPELHLDCVCRWLQYDLEKFPWYGTLFTFRKFSVGLGGDRQYYDKDRWTFDIEDQATKHILADLIQTWGSGNPMPCTHSVAEIPDYDDDSTTGFCAHCGADCGWYCPDSPTHICAYPSTPDDCAYCHSPDERK